VVSGVKLEGNYLDREDEFKSLVAIRPGEPYNADQVTETTKAFSEYFGRFGFAFARVEAVPDIDRENNRVSLVLQAEPARRAYVRRINVSGNNRTRDEVCAANSGSMSLRGTTARRSACRATAWTVWVLHRGGNRNPGSARRTPTRLTL
jgi:hypothetical protein